MQSACYSCQGLIELEFSGRIFEKYSNAKFRENPPSGSHVDGRKDGRGKANSHLSEFCERVRISHPTAYKALTI